MSFRVFADTHSRRLPVDTLLQFIEQIDQVPAELRQKGSFLFEMLRGLTDARGDVVEAAPSMLNLDDLRADEANGRTASCHVMCSGTHGVDVLADRFADTMSKQTRGGT